MRKKNKFGVLVFLIFVSFAILIKLGSALGVDDKITECMQKVSGNEAFIRYAISGESQITEDYGREKIINVLFSETAVEFEKMEDVGYSEVEKTPVVTECEKESLTVWEYVSGGERTEKTYPIENITISPTNPKGYVTLGSVWVKNDSTKGIDLNWLLKAELPFKFAGKGPHVLIIHTHGSESYLPQGRDSYTLTDVERTENKQYNVISVGDELEKVLKENGVAVVHDRNIYDSPTYNGSYTRALEAIGKQLKENPSIKVVIDLHRDAMTNSDGVKYRTVAEVNGKRVAQMMLVMSTGESGLPHPDWAENLKLAVKIQDVMATKYPGIMRPINLRKERFNMHATKGSVLVEVGTSANSLSEAKESVRLFGKELAGILKSAK